MEFLYLIKINNKSSENFREETELIYKDLLDNPLTAAIMLQEEYKKEKALDIKRKHRKSKELYLYPNNLQTAIFINQFFGFISNASYRA